MRERAKSDPDFCNRFLHYVSQIVDECLPDNSENSSVPEMPDDSTSGRIGTRVFRPFPHPEDPDFEDAMAKDLFDIVSS